MPDFEKISVDQILFLSEIISESDLLQIEFVERKYLRSAPNFSETVNLLEELDLIKIIENRLLPRTRYKIFLEKLTKSLQQKLILKKFIVKCILEQKTSVSEYLTQFLSHFQYSSGQFEFTPNMSQRLKYSGLRNFLMDLEFLYLDESETKYVIAEEYSTVCIELIESQRLSLDEFLKIQQNKIEIGTAAELEVIEYEKRRLSRFPDLISKIEHTALIDVMAGYDIRSFDDVPDKSGFPSPRFIEVKAVSQWSYQFHWTMNEIKKAREFCSNYYLYLLPVLNKDSFDIEGLKIIRDPFSNVYNNSKNWIRIDEVISFSLILDGQNID
jgi:hypothetical protein